MPTQTKKITLDTAALLFGKVVGLLLGMVRLNYLSTYLGVANFGILNFALYFCSLFQILFDFGISQLVTRDLARDLSRVKDMVGKALLLKALMVFAAGVIVGTIGAISHFESLTNWAILLTTVVFAVNGMSLVLLAAFQAQRKMTIVSLYNVLNDLLVSVLVILLLSHYPHVIAVLIITITVSLVNFAFLLVLFTHQNGHPHIGFDRQLWRDMLTKATPFAVSSLGISMYTFIGPTVLKYSRGNVEVGIFTAGYKLISILTLIPTTFSQVVYPIFSDFYANARSKLSKALEDSLRVMAQVSFPVGVGVVILAPKIISLIYPADFEGAAIVLQVAMCGDALVYLAWIVYAFLLALDQQKLCMRISVVMAVASLVLNVILIHFYGYKGVAFAQLLVDLALFTWYFVATRKLGYRIATAANSAKIVLASMVMGFAVYYIRDAFILLSVMVGAIVYFAVLFMVGGLGDQEKEFLSRLLKLRVS